MKPENLVLSKELTKVESPQLKIWKAAISKISPLSNCYYDGLMLETTDFQTACIICITNQALMPTEPSLEKSAV